jgi:hypothetical protein
MGEKRSSFGGRSGSSGVPIASPVALWTPVRPMVSLFQVRQTIAPERKTGGSFEFRRDNSFCIFTYVLPDFLRAGSTRTADDCPVIVIDAAMPKSDADNQLGNNGSAVLVQPFYYLRRLLKNMEVDADGLRCSHAQALIHEPDAIERASVKMLEFGNRQTGAHYPHGESSARTISGAEERR